MAIVRILMLLTSQYQLPFIDRVMLPEKQYLYVYVCEMDAYVKVNGNNQGQCNPNCNYPCSYESNKDLGVIASEKKLKAEKAIPSTHKGCRILN